MYRPTDNSLLGTSTCKRFYASARTSKTSKLTKPFQDLLEEKTEAKTFTRVMYPPLFLKGGFDMRKSESNSSGRPAQETFRCRFCKNLYVESTYQAHLVLNKDGRRRCPAYEGDEFYGEY